MTVMATTLSFQHHLAGLERAAGRFAYHASRASGETQVPTCPEWTLNDLIVHLCIIHRWAAENLRGRRHGKPTEDQVRHAAGDEGLVAYFRNGYRDLSNALAQADPDLEAMVFLNEAPPPREFWARRQCHETTMHAVDALATALGRVPAAEECSIDTGIAVDGIDELLTGFVTRQPTEMLPGSGHTISIETTDARWAWTVRAEDKLVTTQGAAAVPDTVFSGTAAQLYLGLWNRGEEIVETGDSHVLELWRDSERIT